MNKKTTRKTSGQKNSRTSAATNRPKQRNKRPNQKKPTHQSRNHPKPDKTTEDDPLRPERVQKILAAAGLGSRRGLEREIEAGQIDINGERASLGDTVKAGDKVRYGHRQFLIEPDAPNLRTLMYNKPVGQVTTRKDPEGRPTVFDNLPYVKQGRWVSIGRLDLNTSGLLLLTTDGELANHMMHPSSGIDREYACRIYGEVSDEQIETLKAGVQLEDGPASFSDVQRAGETDGENAWFHVVIMEGRNREVRRLWESQDVKVSRLKRVRYGAVFLPKHLRRGHWQELSREDHRILREDAGLEPAGDRLLAVPA